MLMVDNVFVGMNAKASAIPNEQFQIYLDGELVTTTTDCSYVLEGIANGNHTIGIKATYLKAQSETTTIEANIPSDAYSHVILNVTANSKLTANGQHLTLTNTATMESYDLTVADGKVELASLPNGQYAISTEEGAFQALQKAVTINADATIDITLNDYLLKPYNITAKLNDDATYTLRWNQELIFRESSARALAHSVESADGRASTATDTPCTPSPWAHRPTSYRSPALVQPQSPRLSLRWCSTPGRQRLP